ncbi:MAG: methyltransferase domain-containing protein [Bernardetiaceae bacterium]|jgi:2-polyprenyl-6-hydroxyphenyl methylase/3-demethylubiquinone-9 3-methyltransferase|nr:methyltransferase domain-containing protein [Bernardetiaceae bacterium]
MAEQVLSESAWEKFSSFVQRKIFRSYRARLNYQYKRGGWDWLAALDEMAHHAILGGYFRFNKKGGTLLDLGCGEGVLQDNIGHENYSYYIGVDLSDDAIRIANERRGNEKTFFYQGNMDKYVPPRKFDVIAINEALYFSEDPLKLLSRLEAYLETDGFFMISMVDKRGDHIWDVLNKHYAFLDENYVTNIKKITWVCRMLKRAA